MCTEKMRALSYKGAEKITFPPKPDIQTEGRTKGRTDSVYRVASLLKKGKYEKEGKKQINYRVTWQPRACNNS